MVRHTNTRHYQIVERALLYLQSHRESQPSLAAVAAHCAMSEYHFQRIFKQWAGVSPKRFLQCLTREQCLARLMEGGSLHDVSIEAGLSGSSRLHDLLVTLDAVTPGEIKSGGEQLSIHWSEQETPFGKCFIAATDRGIHRLEFIAPDQPEAPLNSLREQWPNAELTRNDTTLSELKGTIFTRADATLPPISLWIKGSPFQFKVWEALLKVPPGQLCTYRQLATTIGAPNASRAVGNAVANNPIALLIPCHRVIRGMGVIGQYRWGEIRKQALLGWEASRFETPTGKDTTT